MLSMDDILDAAFAKAGVVAPRPFKRIPRSTSPKPLSRSWVRRVGSLLRDGYGSEDIAIILECRPDQVSAQMKRFREAGLIKEWFAK